MSRLNTIEAMLETPEKLNLHPIVLSDLRYLLKVARAADNLCEATGGWHLPTTVGGSRFGPTLAALRAAFEGDE